MTAPVPPGLRGLRERGVAVVPHGIRLNLGGAAPVEPARVAHFAACAALVGAPVASEHIAFVRAGDLEAGHLLPLPRTREAVAVLTRNVHIVQSEVDAPIALEPIAALFDWPEDELTEAEFLTEILDRTGALFSSRSGPPVPCPLPAGAHWPAARSRGAMTPRPARGNGAHPRYAGPGGRS